MIDEEKKEELVRTSNFIICFARKEKQTLCIFYKYTVYKNTVNYIFFFQNQISFFLDKIFKSPQIERRRKKIPSMNKLKYLMK